MKTMMQFRNLSILLLLFVSIACSQKQGEGNPQMQGQPREYQVIAVQPQSITLSKQYPATLEGEQTVEIRPRIAGYIEKILVDEGAYVKKNEVLFRINANDIEAQVRSAEALVKVAEAQVSTAKINLEKTKPLVEREIISKFDLESTKANLQVAKAKLAQAKANMENAKANLQYTVITSPTDGYIGNFPYRAGSLVSSTSAQPLTTVSNTSNMYAYFAMNEKEFLTLTKGLEGKNMQDKLAKIPSVSLILADNTPYKTQGIIQTASGLVDQQTGAINLRAIFQNTDGTLRSGGSGLISIPEHMENVLIIPQKVTFELQGKHFVYVVGEGNKVRSSSIDVTVGNLKDSYVVTGGLSSGDQIVIEGIASLRNDTPIKPKLVEGQKLTESPAKN